MLTEPSSGGVVLVGQLSTTLNWAGRTITHRGKGDVWVARFVVSGRPLWHQMWGGTEPDEGRAVAADADSVYVAGVFQSPSMAMGAFTLSASHVNTTDIFLARLNGTTGEVVWARAFGTAAIETAASVAVAADGGVVLAGSFTGASLPLDAATTLSNANAAAGGNSTFVATFAAADGQLRSATAYADMQSLARMVRDPATGAVYFVGTDYVSRLGSWRASLAGSNTLDVRRSIAMDPASRHVFVAGQFVNTTLTLGRTVLVNGDRVKGGNIDGYVARLDAATGEITRAWRINGNGQEIVLGLAVDSNTVFAAGKYCWVWGGASLGVDADDGRDAHTDTICPSIVCTRNAGTFNFNMNLTQPTLTPSSGSTDIFLLRYDYEGNAIWGSRYGGSNTEFVSDLQTDAFGGLYMAGSATSPTGISFGPALNLTNGPFLTRLMTVRESFLHPRPSIGQATPSILDLLTIADSIHLKTTITEPRDAAADLTALRRTRVKPERLPVARTLAGADQPPHCSPHVNA